MNKHLYCLPSIPTRHQHIVRECSQKHTVWIYCKANIVHTHIYATFTHAHTHMYARTYVHTSIYVCSQEMTVTVAKASYIATHIHIIPKVAALYYYSRQGLLLLYVCMCVLQCSQLSHIAHETHVFHTNVTTVGGML